MNKTLKWISICVIGFALPAVAAVVSLPFFINPNDFKPKITELVKKQTGRTLLIPGDITLRVTPRLDIGFALGEIRLAAAGSVQAEPFASSKLAKLNLALWPLISKKELVIKSLVLQDVQLNLVRNQNGQGNWEDLLGKQGTSERRRSPAVDRKSPSDSQQQMALDIGGIEIHNINISYQDLNTGVQAAVKNFNLTIGHLLEGKSFPVSADFQLSRQENGQEPLTARITSSGEYTMFLRDKRFLVNNAQLQATFEGQAVPAHKQEIKLITDAEIDLGRETINISRLTVNQGVMTVDTALTLSGFTSPALDGTLKIPEFSPRQQMRKLDIAVPRFSDPETLTALSTSLSFALKDNILTLDDIKVHLDDSSLTAKTVVHNLGDPAYSLILDLDRVDLDRYAVEKNTRTTRGENKNTATEPADTTETAVGPTQPGTVSRPDEKIIIPVQLLQGLNFTADIKISALKAAQLHAADIVVKADGKDGFIRLHPLSAALYDGTLQVTGVIDVQKDIPELQLEKEIKGVRLGPLFVDLTGKEEMSGKANISADVTTRGLTAEELTGNANGSLKFSLDNGKIAKLQILHTIRMAKALLEKKPMALESKAQPTGFATLTAGGRLTNGVFTSNDLIGESDLMKVTGKGTVDFVNRQIDYLLTVYLTDRIERSEETGLVALGNTPIPYRVKGSFSKLEQSAALEEVVKAKAKQVLMDELQKRIAPDKDKKGKSGIDSGSLIEQGLKGLFGN